MIAAVGAELECSPPSAPRNISRSAAVVADAAWNGARRADGAFLFPTMGQQANLTGPNTIAQTVCTGNGTRTGVVNDLLFRAHTNRGHSVMQCRSKRHITGLFLILYSTHSLYSMVGIVIDEPNARLRSKANSASPSSFSSSLLLGSSPSAQRNRHWRPFPDSEGHRIQYVAVSGVLRLFSKFVARSSENTCRAPNQHPLRYTAGLLEGQVVRGLCWQEALSRCAT